MTKLYNISSHKNLRRNLRQQEIRAEKLIWWKIRNNQLGYKFRRQYGIGNYIVDFYCPALKLAIEIDGATHSSRIEIKNDRERQQYIESLGITVIRYLNSEVKENLNGVLENIISTSKNLEKAKANFPSFARRG